MLSQNFFMKLFKRCKSNVLTTKRGTAFQSLPPKLRNYILRACEHCTPEEIRLCDGSEKEGKLFVDRLIKDGTIVPLPKYCNCYLARTDPRDVARVEGKTFLVYDKKTDAIPEPAKGVKGQLGNWMSPEEMQCHYDTKFKGCMKGRTMYVLPYSMGPPGGPLSKMGIQITDSTYVAAASRIMTRMGSHVSKLMNEKNQDEIVLATHSVGVPVEPNSKPNPWPCDPERTLILHKPDERHIISFGSGYGGNSLLGKKCFALRIGSTIAKKEGWLAEHMLILGITPPDGKKRYICAAFPSACGKTNLAMLTPSIPGYKIETVGDDIAWIKFNPKTCMFHAINPENGFFGVAPGTSCESNPNAMRSIFRDTVFTNVAMTSDGGVWWEGMEELPEDIKITDWHGKPWDRKSKKLAAHANSRFAAPIRNLPTLDPDWESPEGVPISAMLFGGRRPEGVPLIYQSFSWEHGVLVGAMMRSESTAAAEHKGKKVMHDPFGMRPFFGYNFGHYIQHWLDMPKLHPGIILPKIFHVNWFRKSKDGKWLWPGYGENIRVLDWVLRRSEENPDDSIAEKTPIGWVPKESSLDLKGLKDVNMKELMSVPTDFWKNEIDSCCEFFNQQLPNDLPDRMIKEIQELKERINKAK